jgi:hypothetical protein
MSFCFLRRDKFVFFWGKVIGFWNRMNLTDLIACLIFLRLFFKKPQFRIKINLDFSINLESWLRTVLINNFFQRLNKLILKILIFATVSLIWKTVSQFHLRLGLNSTNNFHSNIGLNQWVQIICWTQKIRYFVLLVPVSNVRDVESDEEKNCRLWLFLEVACY